MANEPILLDIYFESDGTDWYVRELEHRDRQIINGDDWVGYDRELLRCPLGQAYVADTAFDADLPPSSITFADLFVRAF